MRIPSRLTALLMLGVFVLAAGTSCERAQARLPADTLVVLEAGDATTLNPIYSNNEYSFDYEYIIMDPLVQIGDHLQSVPWLATSWTSTPDHLHWTVQLRRGVRWSDGVPFTSKDVVFSFDTYLNPAVGFYYRGQFTYIKDVRALGPYTVRFDLSQPNALFVSGALGLWMLPQHVLGKIPPAEIHTSDFGEHPIGTGPYMLVRWRHDDEIVFERNPHWWGGVPKIAKIDVHVVLNPASEREAMQNGTADFVDGLGSSDFALLKRDDPHVQFVHIPDLFTEFIDTNDSLPGLRDVRVRQAMIYGWDRKALIDGLFHGDGLVATGIEPHALTYWYDPHVRQYPYDPLRARAILDGDGWKLGPGGVRERDGTKLSFTLVMPNAGPGGTDLAAEFQADMRAIGIAVDVKELDYATFIDETNKGDFQLALTGWGGTPDPDEYTFLDSKQDPPVGNNYQHYANPAVDRVLEAGLRELNRAKRRALYNRFQRLTAEDPPFVFGYDIMYRAAFSARVRFNGAPLLPGGDLWYYIWRWSLAS